MKRSQHILTTALLLAALALSGPAAWAVRKTVTYTFTAEKVDGKSEARKLTFTPSGDQFGTNPGAKTVTIENTSNTTGFTVKLDDGVTLNYLQNAGLMTFSSSNGITDGFFLNSWTDQNPRFVISCTDYYIRHVKLADKSGTPLVGTGYPAASSNGAIDVDVDIDKAGSSGTYTRYEVTSVIYSQTFGSFTITLANFAAASGSISSASDIF